MHSTIVSEEHASSNFRQPHSLYLSTTLHTRITVDSNLHRHCHEKLKLLVEERRFFLKAARYIEVTFIRSLLESQNVRVYYVFQWNVKISDLLQLSVPSALYFNFRRFRKIATSFVMSVRLVLMEQLGSHCTDLHGNLYLSIVRKSFEKIQGSLKSDKNIGHLTWRRTYVYDHTSLSSSYSEKCCSQKL